MDWVLTVLAGLVIAVVSGGVGWRLRNLSRLRVSVESRALVASFPIDPREEHTLEVTMTNTGNKVVNIEQCYFTMDGEGMTVEVARERLATMKEGLPRKLDPGEQCVIRYPAVAFQGKRLTRVAVGDYLGKRWYAPSRDVKRAEANLGPSEKGV